MAVLRTLALVTALSLCLPNPVPGLATAEPMSEYALKAVFLVNFAKFIDWPDPAFSGSDAALAIGVVGNDPFGSDLDDAIKGKLVGTHSIVAKRIDWRDDMSHLSLIFIGASEKRRLPDILRRLDTSTAVTVSDIDRFCDAGGIIAFVVKNNQIRFEVNVEAAQKKNLKISSKLLSLALIHKSGD
ncbi:MAG: hypothetical protein PVSMB1_05690 [Gemmatimonadaceae bacterium]